MTNTSRRTLVKIGMFGDLAICGVSLIMASTLPLRPFWETDSRALQHPLRRLLLTSILACLWHLSLRASGAYRSYRIAGLVHQTAALARGATAATFWAAVWLCVSPHRNPLTEHAFFHAVPLFWGFTFSGLLFTRVCARIFTRYLRRHGHNLRQVLIVGTNSRAIALAQTLTERANYGFRVAGFVDDFWHYAEAPESYKQMLLGNSGNILELLRTRAIDEVIIALPIASFYHLTNHIVDLCRQQGIPVRSEGSFFNAGDMRFRNESSLRLITHHEIVRSDLSILCKRAMDIVVSTAVLVVFSPVLLAIAIAIKLTSPGPILFAQERLGTHKHRFRIWKFRTMVVNAEALMAAVEHLNQSQGPTFKLKNDPRITKVGAFLRKTSLDELPQFFNVFLGDMSLVGPRPLPLRDYLGFSSDWHRRRFSVKPGITCLWQITGRSSIGFDQWMELDMDYIDRWTIWLDLEILIKTIPAVIRGSGAM